MSEKSLKRRSQILSLLEKEKPIRKQRLAERYGVAPRTIQRDINSLIDKGHKIESASDGYKLKLGKMLTRSTKDSCVMATLLLAHTAVDRRFACFGSDIVETIKSKLLKQDGASYLEYSDNFPTDPQLIPMSQSELANFGEVAKAIINEQPVRMYYTSIGYENGVHHEIFPVQLKERDSVWYLLAYDYYYQARRVFALSRMDDVELSEENHPMPDKSTILSIQNHGNFSIWDDPEVKAQRIKIRLYNYAAWHIQERKIHQSQKHKIISKDEVELTLTTGDFLGVKLWLRKFAPDVKILQPAWFRDEFIADLKVSLERYSNK